VSEQLSLEVLLACAPLLKQYKASRRRPKWFAARQDQANDELGLRHLGNWRIGKASISLFGGWTCQRMQKWCSVKVKPPVGNDRTRCRRIMEQRQQLVDILVINCNLTKP
jgi:hypothetical protein